MKHLHNTTIIRQTLTKQKYDSKVMLTSKKLDSYIEGTTIAPLFFQGDALTILKNFPSESIDCCITSPPYWGKRQYRTDGIGMEKDYNNYIDSLCTIFRELLRILKVTGSFWLNIGDSYYKKNLLGIPWRIALELTDRQGWILRNEVVWNKIKGGPDNALDKLGNVHEKVFHFVKSVTGYYYDVDSIRANPQKTKIVNGSVISATGVHGVRYKRQIELSTALNEMEKQIAQNALNEILNQVRGGKLADFRMVIRGQQRTTHSDSTKVSGRAKELQNKGFYFLKYHPNGSKPRDVWDILPEDTQNREFHYAPFPEDLCKMPIIATCPIDGIVLDPFSGTGTAMLVAKNLGRKSIGIDLCAEYIDMASKRCATLF
ncbi:MAG: site-specific DNA-methyltransferase [Planctomycetaceae bacterium]|jgi:DNA modification methylase|nr:site-specific DNA-methyltransferase [Planctomycetaceae bacterium]